MQSGFIDLRQNNGRTVEESFWPSFTDVMTVIVMVFLIATTVLIVKNWELVNELQKRIVHEKEISSALQSTIDEKNKTHAALLESIEAKKKISQKLQASIEELERTNALAEQNQAENITLDERLQHAQSTLALLKLQLTKSHEEISLKSLQLIEKDKQLEQKQITEKDLLSEINQLNERLSASNKALSNTNKTLSDTNQTLVDKNKLLTESTTLNESKEKEIIAQLEKIKGWQKRFDDLNVLNNELKTKLEDNTTNLSALEKARAILAATEKALEKKLAESHDNIVLLRQQLEDKSTQVNLIQDKLTKSDQQLLVTQRELEILNKDAQSKDDLLTKMQADIEQAKEADNEKELKYAELEDKYNKLIRPARSSVGKYVVEVRYQKKSGVGYKEAGKQYESLSNKVLNKKLSALKKQYGDRLYVKVIIPDDSGLSYNEAWKFMQDIFNKYDYYYQGKDNEL